MFFKIDLGVQNVCPGMHVFVFPTFNLLCVFLIEAGHDVAYEYNKSKLKIVDLGTTYMYSALGTHIECVNVLPGHTHRVC